MLVQDMHEGATFQQHCNPQSEETNTQGLDARENGRLLRLLLGLNDDTDSRFQICDLDKRPKIHRAEDLMMSSAVHAIMVKSLMKIQQGRKCECLSDAELKHQVR